MPIRQHRFCGIKINPALFGQGADINFNADPVAQHLPRHNVGMMFQLREEDAVPRLQKAAPAIGQQVDRLGRAAHKDNLIGVICPDKGRHLFAGQFIGQRHIGGARIDAPMDRRIIFAQRTRHGIDHSLRLLRRRGGVEIMPVLQAGEVGLVVPLPLAGGPFPGPSRKREGRG